MRNLSFASVLLTAGCVVYQPVPTYTLPQAATPPAPVTYQPPPPPPEPAAIAYEPPPPPPVVSVYVEPPIDEPPPIAVAWAPPPMLVEEPPPPPIIGAVWIGGFWVWHGAWVWDHGRWGAPPRPGYVWVHPYYENRGGTVIFVTGHWGAVGVAFVPPPPGLYIAVERPLPGVIPGPACIGPEGVFVPAPPGSRHGIIIPAPVGTAPAVVTGAPAVVNVGMRITNNVNSNNTTVVNNVTNVTNVTNITHVTIVAPPGATATGQAVNTSVPAQAHLAAALPPMVKVAAPPPASQHPIPAFARGRPPVALPPPQAVHAIVQAPRRPMPPSPAVVPAAPAAATPAAPTAPPPAAPAVAAPVAPHPAPPPAAAAVAAPMAPHPAPPENAGAGSSRQSFDRRDQEREPHAMQPAPAVQPTPTVQPAPKVTAPAANSNIPPPVPKAAAPGAAPKNPQNNPVAVVPTREKPASAEGAPKGRPAEQKKQSEKDKPKEGEKDKEQRGKERAQR